LHAAVNFDFILILINFDFILCNSNFYVILYYNLLLCFIQLEMHVRLIRAIKFYLLTYLLRVNYWGRYPRIDREGACSPAGANCPTFVTDRLA